MIIDYCRHIGEYGIEQNIYVVRACKSTKKTFINISTIAFYCIAKLKYHQFIYNGVYHYFHQFF